MSKEEIKEEIELEITDVNKLLLDFYNAYQEFCEASKDFQKFQSECQQAAERMNARLNELRQVMLDKQTVADNLDAQIKELL